MSNKNEKWIEYATKITSALGELFIEDNENFIDVETDLLEGDNLTDFIHALANVAPARIFNGITRNEKNFLEFNHIANRLCFQYSNKSEEKEEV